MVDALRCAGSERVVGDAVAEVVFEQGGVTLSRLVQVCRCLAGVFTKERVVEWAVYLAKYLISKMTPPHSTLQNSKCNVF
jgi:hypothetical protein